MLTRKQLELLLFINERLKEDEYDDSPDYYFVRELDRPPTILHADDLLDDVMDVRTPACRA